MASTLAITILIFGADRALGDEKSLSDTDREFFEEKIRPILIDHCYECHDSTGKKQKGGLSLNSPSGLLNGGDTGPAIHPGSPDDSLLVKAVGYQDRDLQMPPKSPLPVEAVEHLQSWIAMGAPDPRLDDPNQSKPVTGMTPGEGRQFWSFKSPTPAEPPPPTLPEFEINPIDRFVSARLNQAELSPASRASDSSWLRRVTFDLLGLPPTPSEIANFTADPSPDKYASAVDRMLKSPQYGVRWGRHWLDVARYADSNGLDENLTFGNAWRYRDYVIDSFNNDKPFDQFLIEQIAGDLLPDANETTLAATGFLALGARVLAEPDREKLEMDVIDEQLDTTGKAFLGLTLGCARCHDHKFDPILQSDYYSLAAIFRSSSNFAGTKKGAIKHWFEHSFATPEQEAEIKEWDDRIAETKKEATTFKNETVVKLRGEARSRAADYLVACTEFDTTDTLATVAAIAEPLGLHPRILYHSRRHLEVNHESPVFKSWFQFRDQGEIARLKKFYADRFEEASSAAVAKTSKAKKEKKAETDAEKSEAPVDPFYEALFDKSGFLAVPAKPAHAFNQHDLDQLNKLEEAARVLESGAPDHPGAMGIADSEEIIENLPIHIRGDHMNLGNEVPRAIPAVFSDTSTTFPAQSSGRLELAQWMADKENPLTARVIVNRIWRWHFGQGLVETTENFGVMGDRPSHPELLDWLACWFMENGWSIKKMNRLIVLSNTYSQSTLPGSGAYTTVDPENELLSFFPLKRLEAESVRDAILSISGQIDTSLGGKSIPLRNRQMVFHHTSKDHVTYDSLRRSAYLPIVRNHLFDWLSLFDYPDPTMPTGDREATVIAPQALIMMNAPLMIDSAAALAEKINRNANTDPQKIQLAWTLVYGREPNKTESNSSLQFIQSSDDQALAWTLLCQSLLASNEFLYLH